MINIKCSTMRPCPVVDTCLSLTFGPKFCWTAGVLFLKKSITSPIMVSNIFWYLKCNELLGRWRFVLFPTFKKSITSPIMVSNIFWDPWYQLISQSVLRSSALPLYFNLLPYCNGQFLLTCIQRK